MGQPKAMLPFGPGEVMLQRVVRIAGEAVSAIVVVAAPDQDLPPARLGPDRSRPDRGSRTIAGDRGGSGGAPLPRRVRLCHRDRRSVPCAGLDSSPPRSDRRRRPGDSVRGRISSPALSAVPAYRGGWADRETPRGGSASTGVFDRGRAYGCPWGKHTSEGRPDPFHAVELEHSRRIPASPRRKSSPSARVINHLDSDRQKKLGHNLSGRPYNFKGPSAGTRSPIACMHWLFMYGRVE